MECSCKSIDKVNDFLMSLVRQGNISMLEEYLPSIPNPDQYLNRVFGDEFMEQCSLLTIACLNEHINLMRVLIKRFQPDLEIKNDILFGDGHTNRLMCFSATILWAAAAIDNFDIVKLLVEHGANVNYTTKTNSTPLRSACYNGNIDMTRYLIENGCDVNLCDNDGRPPLYEAVSCGSMELVQFLLDHGARNFPAICDQVSPLIWVAEKKRTSIVNAIRSHCPLIEQLETEELLGTAFVCFDLDDRDSKHAYEHFTRELELRSIHSLPKT
ncbi:unnamed protein product [Rotaria magnacalcarata]|uniref:Uncharacterized protein n=1 Tax=Rotaria magnacalcarata TaxID=392030 RepID=A0A816P2G2_9BILA|nr:unnamed protein product [Rotaria magnacalcarata]